MQNIQSMLKISRINIMQKHTLPGSLHPAYNSTNKSDINLPSPKKQARCLKLRLRNERGHFIIVGSGELATNLRAFILR